MPNFVFSFSLIKHSFLTIAARIHKLEFFSTILVYFVVFVKNFDFLWHILQFDSFSSSLSFSQNKCLNPTFFL